MYTLQNAIVEFIHYCKFEKNLSSKTIKAYEIDLKQFVTFLQEIDCSIELVNITKIQLRKYLERISSFKPKSIKRKVATLKALFNHMEFEDIIVVNPLRKMRISIRESKQLPRVMDISEIKGIFKAAHQQYILNQEPDTYAYKEALRNIAVIELLFATGARVSEIANLKMDHLDLAFGLIILKGKGNKERLIQICNKESLEILNSYYRVFEIFIKKSGGYFLINRLGNRLSDQSIRNVVKALSGIAGIQRHVTPHVFRHTFATLLLEKNVDIKYIQSLLGHSSIMTTQIYTHVNKEKQKEILIAKHPRTDFFMSYESNAG